MGTGWQINKTSQRSKKAKVLVLHARGRVALAVIRSLGQKGIKVICGDDLPVVTGFFSKYCSERVIYPSAKYHPHSFLNFMFEHIKKNNYDMIFPIKEHITALFSKYKNRFSQFTRIPVPDYDIFIRARNKANAVNAATSCHIPCPQTYFIDRVSTLESLSNQIEYPVVIKPQESSGAEGIAYIDNPNQLFSEYIRIHKIYPFPIIQEFVQGIGYGVSILMDQKQNLKAVFVHKRLREYPVTGGPSTLRESVKNNNLTDLAAKLLKALKWYGVAMVEFKVDPYTAKPKFMEINPRLWGSIQLPILAGVDFPYLLYKMVVDGSAEEIFEYKVGIRCRLLPEDIFHFLHNPNRFELIPRFFNFFDRNTGYDILSKDDPLPIFGFLMTSLSYFLTNLDNKIKHDKI